ncbi:hypothetical protein CR513_03146, partial [Mucuna pruriens]
MLIKGPQEKAFHTLKERLSNASTSKLSQMSNLIISRMTKSSTLLFEPCRCGNIEQDSLVVVVQMEGAQEWKPWSKEKMKP